jgi:hypothetical protein
MSVPLRNEYFGPYKLIQTLGSAHGAARFVVLCKKTDTNYMLYRFDRVNNHNLRRRMFETLVKMSTLDHPHLLKIISVSYDDQGRLCVITPYTGNHEGLVTLEDLLKVRDGKLGVIEAARALEHLLQATAYAHLQGVLNGPVHRADILVDRYGSIQVQFYGFESMYADHGDRKLSHSVQIADEVRSIVDLGYTMMTGLIARDDRIAPSRVIKKLDRAWDTWFDLGLDPIDGFEDLTHAIKALPTNPDSTEWLTSKASRIPQVHIGSMLRRFRSSPFVPSRAQPEHDNTNNTPE